MKIEKVAIKSAKFIKKKVNSKEGKEARRIIVKGGKAALATFIGVISKAVIDKIGK